MNEKRRPIRRAFAGLPTWAAVVASMALVSVLALPGEAGESRVSLSVINQGSTEHLWVRDENCIRPEREVCEEARLQISVGVCLQAPAAKACLDARQLAEGAICRSDLLYDGLVSQEDTIQVRACVSPGGYASISVRGRDRNTAWHRYLMLNEGDVVKYP